MPLENDAVSIQRLAPGDAEALLAFYRGLSKASVRLFRPFGRTTTLGQCEAVVRDNEPDRDVKFDLVALRGGTIVGWSFLWKLDCDLPSFGLAVADAYQGRGLGSRLTDAVLDAARARGIGKVELTVVQDNATAVAMYERRGFVKQREFVGDDGLPYYGMEVTLGPTQRSGAWRATAR